MVQVHVGPPSESLVLTGDSAYWVTSWITAESRRISIASTREGPIWRRGRGRDRQAPTHRHPQPPRSADATSTTPHQTQGPSPTGYPPRGPTRSGDAGPPWPESDGPPLSHPTADQTVETPDWRDAAEESPQLVMEPRLPVRLGTKCAISHEALSDLGGCKLASDVPPTRS